MPLTLTPPLGLDFINKVNFDSVSFLIIDFLKPRKHKAINTYKFYSSVIEKVKNKDFRVDKYSNKDYMY